MVDAINAVMGTLAGLPIATSPNKDTAVSGGGLINTQWSVDNTKTDTKLTAMDVDARSKSYQSESTFFSPTTISYTIPIITITGSQVSDTGNTSTAQPISYTATTRQEATPTSKPQTDFSPTETESSGLDIPSIVIPAALIIGGAFVATSLIGAVFD